MEKINRQFLFFNTRAAFEEQLKNIKDTSIVFVAEDNIIWTHGVVFGGTGSYLNGYATKAYVDQVVGNIEIPSIHIESEILEGSEDPVSSKALWLALKEKLDTKQFLAKIDGQLDRTSTNLVQNKAVANAIKQIEDSQTQLGEDLQETIQNNIKSYIQTVVYKDLATLLHNASAVEISVVDSLDEVTNPQPNVMYLVLSDSEESLYTMYVYSDGWVNVGTQKAEVSFADYYNKGEIDDMLSRMDGSVVTRLDNYYTKIQVDDKLRRFYDKDYIDDVLNNYYNKDYVDESIQSIEHSISSINSQLKNYYTKNQVDSINRQFVTKPSVYTPDQGFGSEGTDGPGEYTSSQPNHIILEQAEYETLTQYEDDTLYFVLEPREEINWTFGGTFPITFTGGDGIGTFPITLK